MLVNRLIKIWCICYDKNIEGIIINNVNLIFLRSCCQVNLHVTQYKGN